MRFSRIFNKSFFFGMGAMLVLCLVPVVGSKLVSFIADMRNKINAK